MSHLDTSKKGEGKGKEQGGKKERKNNPYFYLDDF